MVRQIIDYGTAGANDGEKLFTAIPKLDQRSTRISQFDPATSSPHQLQSGISGGSSTFTHEDGDEYIVEVSSAAWYTYDFGGVTGKITLATGNLVQWDADALRWRVIRDVPVNVWSMAELRQWHGAFVGEIVQLRQYYSTGAGQFRGAGQFQWIGGPQTDDGGVIVSNGSTTGWRRMGVNDTVSPYWFGAVGDGATTEDHQEFNAAANYCRANGAGIEQLSADVTFLLGGQVDFRGIKSVNIRGLFNTSVQNTAMILIGNSTGTSLRYAEIFLRILRFVGDWSFDDPGSVGITVYGLAYSKVRVEVAGFEIPLLLHANHYSRSISYNEFQIIRLHYGLHLLEMRTDDNGGGANDGWVNDNIIRGGSWSAFTKDTVRWESAIHLNTDGVWGSSQNVFEQPRFEGDANTIITIFGTGLNRAMRIERARIEFNQTPGNLLAVVKSRPVSSRTGKTFTADGVNPELASTTHGFSVNQVVFFRTTGTLPSGLDVDVPYWVVAVDTANDFEVSLSMGGDPITPGSSGSGTHSAYRINGSPSVSITAQLIDVDEGGADDLWAVDVAGGVTSSEGIAIEDLDRDTSRTLIRCDAEDFFDAGAGVIQFPNCNVYSGASGLKLANRQLPASGVSIDDDGDLSSTSRSGPGIRIKRSSSIVRPSFWILEPYQEYIVLALGLAKTFTADGVNPELASTAHGLAVNDRVFLSTTGTLPTGLAVDTAYWVVAVDTANDFELSATKGGGPITPSTAGSGTHSAKKIHRTTDADGQPIAARNRFEYNSITHGMWTSWLWASKYVNEMVIMAAHYNGSSPVTQPFTAREVSGAWWKQIDRDTT